MIAPRNGWRISACPPVWKLYHDQAYDHDRCTMIGIMGTQLRAPESPPRQCGMESVKGSPEWAPHYTQGREVLGRAVTRIAAWLVLSI